MPCFLLSTHYTTGPYRTDDNVSVSFNLALASICDLFGSGTCSHIHSSVILIEREHGE